VFARAVLMQRCGSNAGPSLEPKFGLSPAPQ